jgi:hypothetical protein
MKNLSPYPPKMNLKEKPDRLFAQQAVALGMLVSTDPKDDL